jgi:arsenate reductase
VHEKVIGDLMPEPICNVLFLCTGNSARSVLAEALLNHLGAGRFKGHSAGSTPSGQVNPLALTTLALHGIPVMRPRSKSWDEFAFVDGSSRDMDIIITVCDNAAGEVCPIWPGHPVTAHWGIPDPAAVEGGDAVKQQAFEEAFETLSARIRGLIALPISQLSHDALKKRLKTLAEIQPPQVSP